MSFTREQRARYRDPRGKFCECGQPAVKHESNDFVCQRCYDIQQRNLEYQRPPDTFRDGTFNPNFKYIAAFGMTH